MQDKETVERSVRSLLSNRADVTERRMFGGLAFMVAGNMLCAVGKDHLMVRVGPEQYDAALARPHATEMRFTGKSLRGYVTVDPHGYASKRDLTDWIRTALAHVTTLPPKTAKPAKRQKKKL